MPNNGTPRDGTSEHPFVCTDCNASQRAWDYLQAGDRTTMLIRLLADVLISLGPVAQKTLAQQMAVRCPAVVLVAMREEREWNEGIWNGDPPRPNPQPTKLI